MASSCRPSKPRRCAPKAAKAIPAPARPSTSKPRAKGKPGPVSSKPGRQVDASNPLNLKPLDLKQQLAAAQSWAAANATIVDRVAEQIGVALNLQQPFSVVVELSRLIARAQATDQAIQLACKRLRSALGPLGQGSDDRSTTGHMLAMLEELIEQRNHAGHFERVAHESIIRMRSALGGVVRADAGLRQVTPDDLASIIEALKPPASGVEAAESTLALDWLISVVRSIVPLAAAAERSRMQLGARTMDYLGDMLYVFGDSARCWVEAIGRLFFATADEPTPPEIDKAPSVESNADVPTSDTASPNDSTGGSS